MVDDEVETTCNPRLTVKSRTRTVAWYVTKDRGKTYASTQPATGSRVKRALQTEVQWKAVGAAQARTPKITAAGTRGIRTEGAKNKDVIRAPEIFSRC